MDRTELGRRGEDAAVAYLERIGMTIVERNWHNRAGEIDVVALDGDELVLIEVKTRRSERAGSAEEAVSPTKQKRITRLAAAYRMLSGLGDETPTRFDAITIRVIASDRALLRHYRDAFQVPR